MSGRNVLHGYFLIRVILVAIQNSVVCADGDDDGPVVKLELVIIASTDTSLNYGYDQIWPGVKIAMDKAKLLHVKYMTIQTVLQDHTLPSVYDSPCEMTASSESVGLTYKLISAIQKDAINTLSFATVFLGPACTVDFVACATLYQSYPVGPFMTGASHYTDNSATLKGGIRVAYSALDLWQPFFAIWEENNWTDINVIYYQASTSEPTLIRYRKLKQAYLSARKVRTASSPDSKKHTFKVIFIDHIQATNITDNLDYAHKNARINVLLVPGEVVRRYMLEAHRLGRANGSFVYFTVDPFLSETTISTSPTKGVGWYNGDEDDAVAKSAYRYLLTIALTARKTSASYKKFLTELDSWYLENPSYNFPDLIKNPSYYMMSHHDAILIPAVAARKRANAALENLVMDHEGTPLAKVNATGWIADISDRTYDWSKDGVRSTDSAYIDPTGNLREFFDVYDMTDLETGVFSPVATYTTIPGTLQANYTYTLATYIDWGSPNNMPPINGPDPGCTFDGCPVVDKTWQYVLEGVSVIPAVIVLYLLMSQIRQLYIQHREAYTWVIHPTELTVRWPNGDVTEGQHSEAGLAENQGTHGRSMGSSLHLDHYASAMVAVFLPRSAVWRKQVVILRHSFKKILLLHRALCKEVNFVRSLNHDNILKFMKATVVWNHVAVMYEGAARGTITDLIHQKSAMDWDVRYAFINDIINGMQYLYSKKLRCHSRLTSNCLFLDDHFIVKIGDYGLPSFFELNIVELWFAKKDPAFSVSTLWTAPEVLKDYDSSRGRINPCLLNKSIDIYSFGIILQELILWSGPYSMFPKLSAKEITTYVMHGQNADGGQMRPRFDLTEKNSNAGLIEVAQHCWSEHQYDRPDWPEVQAWVVKTHKLMGVRATESVLDSLVEQLEELTDSLHHQVLEKEAKIQIEEEVYHKTLMLFVPRRLTTGVNEAQYYPRYFSSVTIICSDILTPTLFSVQSTPAEVIRCIDHLYEVYMKTVAASPLTRLTSLLDAVTAIAGVPESEDNHVAQTAKYALDLMTAISDCRLPYKPDTRLQPRIAFTSGSLTGGIMSTSIPKFFVHGEPIKAALRLLYSLGQASGIVIGQPAKELLDGTEYVTEPRGHVPFEDGRLMCYWLHGTREQLNRRFSVHDPLKSVVVRRPAFLVN